MLTARSGRHFLVGLLVASAAVGCSSAPPAVEATGPTPVDTLNEVATMWRAAGGEGRQAPRRLADLTKFEAGGPTGYAAIKSGDLVVVWGAPMAGEGDAGGPAAVVAYEKKVPAEGGYVLLQSGKVAQMTAAEFAAAPKAK